MDKVLDLLRWNGFWCKQITTQGCNGISASEKEFVRIRMNLQGGNPKDENWRRDIKRRLHDKGPYVVTGRANGAVDLAFGSRTIEKVPDYLVEKIPPRVSVA